MSTCKSLDSQTMIEWEEACSSSFIFSFEFELVSHDLDAPPYFQRAASFNVQGGNGLHVWRNIALYFIYFTQVVEHKVAILCR